MYTLDSATQLRNRLINLQKEIDLVSSRIETYGINQENVQNRPVSREQIIQKNIRNFALQTLRELVGRMSLPPSEDLYNELKEKRRVEMKRRTEMERKRNLFILKPSSSNSGFEIESGVMETVRPRSRLKESVSFAGINGTCGDDGWTPSRMTPPRNPFIDEQDKVDPLREQISIIKGYLKQAAEDGRLEEVEILERNLRDLECEVERLNEGEFSSQ